MDIHEHSEVSKAEKITRFCYGALLGFILGFYIVVKYWFESLGCAVAVVVAICTCGYLALKYGDEFSYAIFGRGR